MATSTSIPMVLASSGSLQTLPLTTVLTNGDSSHGSPPRVILHAVPSAAGGTKDVLTIQAASLAGGVAGVGGLQDGLPQQLLVTSLGSSATSCTSPSSGVISTAASHLSGLPRLVTINSTCGQAMVAQQPGTVIATVLKSSGDLAGLPVKEELLDPYYFQSVCNGDPSLAAAAVGTFEAEEEDEDELDGGERAELQYRTMMADHVQSHEAAGGALLNGHCSQRSSPSEGLTPVEELEVRGEMSLQPELPAIKVLQEMPGYAQLPVNLIQIKTEPAET